METTIKQAEEERNKALDNARMLFEEQRLLKEQLELLKNSLGLEPGSLSGGDSENQDENDENIVVKLVCERFYFYFFIILFCWLVIVGINCSHCCCFKWFISIFLGSMKRTNWIITIIITITTSSSHQRPPPQSSTNQSNRAPFYPPEQGLPHWPWTPWDHPSHITIIPCITTII